MTGKRAGAKQSIQKLLKGKALKSKGMIIPIKL